jgi:poly[(R)-3-hydroxyalkanoate] polymerase subunit PhaC
MLSLVGHLVRSWTEGAIRDLEGFRRGLTEPFPLHDEPPAATPYEIAYEAGKVRLRHYRAAGPGPAHPIPLVLVYALIKRPYILDLQRGRSVIENLTRQGLEVYLVDWIPPTRSDSGRGFEAYVNGDLAAAIRTVQARESVEQVSLLGYCFGGLLATIYTALHPGAVKSLVTLTLPFDTGAFDEISSFALMDRLGPSAVDLITDTYGNCPAWLIRLAFASMAPVHHALNKHVDLYRGMDRPGYSETFALFERWMSDDVPLAGRIFREMTTLILRENRLCQNRLEVGGRKVDVAAISCPVLNVIGQYDDVVPPAASRPFLDGVGSSDKRNLEFPNGHMGLAVSGAAQAKLWPEVGRWLKQRS